MTNVVSDEFIKILSSKEFITKPIFLSLTSFLINVIKDNDYSVSLRLSGLNILLEFSKNHIDNILLSSTEIRSYINEEGFKEASYSLDSEIAEEYLLLIGFS